MVEFKPKNGNVTSGKFVRVRFWDHAHTPGNDLAAVHCDVVGFLFKEDDINYYVAAWISDSDLHSTETDVFVVVKAAVLKMTELRELEPVKEYTAVS